MVFGKTGVEEPVFEVLMKHSSSAGFPYEVRKYGQRYAAETLLTEDNDAFSRLARYIGVFGEPENEGSQPISMTAPVAKETKPATTIAMTAPVVKRGQTGNEQQRVMQFYLPSQYDSYSKIPKPTNPAVYIREIPPAVGAVHRYSGSFSDEVARENVRQLVLQLNQDGVENLTEQFALTEYLWWGYNPPFTLPPLRRNEVWIPLTPQQVERLVNGFSGSDAN